MSTNSLSEHPVDLLIREAVESGRIVKSGEIKSIRDRIASAGFDPRLARVAAHEQGNAYLNRSLQNRDDSLFVHLVRRVMIDEQWAKGTTAVEYLADLHRAALADSASLAIYARRGGILAATLTPTNRVIPPKRLGPRSRAELFVAYSADRGIIVTGYQVSNRDLLGIPEEARWLL